MIQRILSAVRDILLCLALLVATSGFLPANAASSEWFETVGGKMRLVTAANPDSREIQAALEVQLKPGWKTYWRSPGESGIPPQFDFSGSSNVLSATVKFPTPEYFVIQGARTIGYEGRVVFPIQVETARANTPTVLKVKLVIGICSVVCIPVLADMSVTESGISSPTFDVMRTLNEGRASLPTGPEDNFRVVDARVEKDQPTMMRIESIVDENAGNLQLHVEGPPDWYLLPARLTGREGNKAQFLLDITDIPEDAAPEKTELRFTLVADGRGIEQVLLPAQ